MKKVLVSKRSGVVFGGDDTPLIAGPCVVETYKLATDVAKELVKIGKNTIIGGQSFVYKNCKSYSIYSGIPAKKIRNRTVNEKYL